MRSRSARPRIFLSYRREDASGHAGRLYDVLARRYGAENVFMDIDTIDVGADFADAISRAVASCDVLIALIGRDWLQASDATGRRRLDDPADFVRLELEAALARDVAVVPALVRGASFPDTDDLPASLASLARRHGAELRDIGWHDDVERLLERIERIVSPGEPRPRRPWRSRRALAAVAAVGIVAVAAAAAFVLFTERRPTSGAPFPNALEQQLLALVPPVTRPHCARIDWGDEAARAAVECSGEGISATYHLFESQQVRDGWYVRTREEASVAPRTGSCSAGSFSGEATYNGDEDGRYVCWFDDEQEPLLAWKHGANAVGARANAWQKKGRPGAESLLRQWRCCLRPQS